MEGHRTERDSMGEVLIPKDALYGAQTARAIENFRISGRRFPRPFIRALGLIKAAAALANASLGLLDKETARAIAAAAGEVASGAHDAQFPLDIFQTGSGTSTNMNANEVIARLASEALGRPGAVHPNDHVNLCQSSNDVIPSAIHLSALLEVVEVLLPGLDALASALEGRARELRDIPKTGRTHLMDAMPLTFGQEFGGYAHQVREASARIEGVMPRLMRLALGGTAVGTGINAHPDFGRMAAERLAERTGLAFRETPEHFSAQAAMDTALELSGQLKVAATAVMKIANDLRLMNSGPVAGLGEISLPALQPGSSIMPGKVNPVIPEAAIMACAQVVANDMAVALGNQWGNLELNAMLPLIASNLLESVHILGAAGRTLGEKAVLGFAVNSARVAELIGANPILVTALNPVLGYDKAAEIAKRAYREGRSLRDVALEMTSLTAPELDRILDPLKLTRGGFPD